MNGNNPDAGRDETVDAGRRMSADYEVTDAQRRALRTAASRVAARTREYLPGEYAVGAEVTAGADGARVTVAVQPPVGSPVTAGLEPAFDGGASETPVSDDPAEVARGLAASAALQVKQVFDDENVAPVAR